MHTCARAHAVTTADSITPASLPPDCVYPLGLTWMSLAPDGSVGWQLWLPISTRYLSAGKLALALSVPRSMLALP